jgi:hypothetical protein
MSEVYGRRPGERVDDVTWITEMTSRGYALITSDSAITQNAIERQAILDCGAIVFIIPNGEITAEDVIERILTNARAINIAAEGVGPAGFAIYPFRISRVIP